MKQGTIVVLLALAGFLWVGCSTTDSLGITESSVVLGDDGKPVKGPDGAPAVQRDWSPTAKAVVGFAGDSTGPIGLAVAVLAGAGTLVMKLRSRKALLNSKQVAVGKEKIAAFAMLIIKDLLNHAKDIAKGDDGKLDMKDLKRLPEILMTLVKSKAAEYKAKLDDPADWERILRHVKEIVAV